MRSNSLLAEKPVTLKEASKKHFPNRPHINTLRRYCHKGFRGVKLRSFYSGNTLCTTEAAIEEFWAAINPSSAPSPISSAHALAESRLDELGV